jgi:hypothetical protein
VVSHRGATAKLQLSTSKFPPAIPCVFRTQLRPVYIQHTALWLYIGPRSRSNLHITTRAAMAEPPVVPPIEPPPPPETSRPLHTLPAPFSHEALEVITQGAEALVYKTTFLTPNTPVVVKYRPPKPYRHPTLDKRLTKQRLLAEARSLIRVKRGGVNVPGVIGADWDAGWLVLEYVDGRTVRKVLDGWAHQVTQR